MKRITHNHRVVRLFIFLVIILIAIVFAGCEKTKMSVGTNDIEDSTADHDSNQLYSYIIPEALFGGSDAKDIIEEYTNPNTTFLIKTGEEVPASDMISDVKLNEDGTLTYCFTASQLERYQSFLYDCAALYTYIGTVEGTSIINTEFPNDELTEIVINVDSNTYENTGQDGIYANG